MDMIVISWDTAMKSTELADYSVGTVWHVQGDKYLSARSGSRALRLSRA